MQIMWRTNYITHGLSVLRCDPYEVHREVPQEVLNPDYHYDTLPAHHHTIPISQS